VSRFGYHAGGIAPNPKCVLITRGIVVVNHTTCRRIIVLLAGIASLSSATAAEQLKSGQPPVLTLTPVRLNQVKAEGEFGRRIRQIIENDILKVDVEQAFLQQFRERPAEPFPYLGCGKFLDAVVRLASCSGDSRLVALKQKMIGELIATQDADGYLGWVKDPQRRIRQLWDLHEASYLTWALVSDYSLFGEKASLEAARKLADNFTARFSADPTLRPDTSNGVVTFEGSQLGFDRALLALSRETGDPKYRDFCVRVLKLGEFNPAIKMGPTSLANHAYTYLGHSLAQLDLFRVSGDPDLLRAPKRAVDFFRHGNGMLVTGTCSEGECWHDTQSGLQNTAETCMGAYVIRLLDSLLQLEGDSLYGDMMERTIYNAMFAAVSPDGRRNRYFTPFDGRRSYDRHGDRFCCHNNLRRFFADLPGWMYYQTSDGIAVNLYNASTTTLEPKQGLEVKLQQETDYPTSGDVLLRVTPSLEAEFTLRLRIPRWCRTATVSVNGAAAEEVAGGRFHSLARVWKAGDQVALKLPMEWRLVKGRQSQTGRAAILRGPVIFTLNPKRNPEFSKHPDFEPRQLLIDPPSVEIPLADDSVRPHGMACQLKAWPPGNFNFWPFIDRMPLVLTEFPDAGGEGIYFLVPDSSSPLLVDDELFDLPAGHTNASGS
jgi:DUF1680 family protein